METAFGFSGGYSMKDFIMLILQIVVVACILGTFGTVMNYFFDWSIGFKGAELPADLRATALFVVLGGVSAAIVYFGDRPKAQNNPD
jgi:hypothetical protein